MRWRRSSPLARILHTLWRIIILNRKATIGICLVLFFILVALFGPLFIHTDPGALSNDVLVPPSATHWLGTTQTGQDIFSQLIVGTRVSILWGFATGLVVTTLSVIVGLISGYLGGIVDDALTLLINVFLVLPGFPLAVVLAAYLPSKGPLTVALVNNDALLLGAWWWYVAPGMCIALLGAGLALINFGIDEVANPRLRSETRLLKRISRFPFFRSRKTQIAS